MFSDLEEKRRKIKEAGSTVVVIDEKEEEKEDNSLIIKTIEPQIIPEKNDFSQRRFSEPLAFREAAQKAFLTTTHKEAK